MCDEQEVVWCWSLNEKNTIFIFRGVYHKEFKVDLEYYKNLKLNSGHPLYTKKEVALIKDLIEQIRE